MNHRLLVRDNPRLVATTTWKEILQGHKPDLQSIADQCRRVCRTVPCRGTRIPVHEWKIEP